MKTIQLVGGGDNPRANNPATLTPGDIPVVPGDLALVLAASRAMTTVTIATPLGWRCVAREGGMSLFGRVIGSGLDGVGDEMPACVFTGGVAGDTGIVGAYGLRFAGADVVFVRAEMTPLQANAVAQDIAVPAITTSTDGCLILTIAVKQDNLTSVSLPGCSQLVMQSTTLGDDAAMIMLGEQQVAAGVHPAGTITVVGGAAAASWAMRIAIRPYVTSLSSPSPTDSPCDFAEVAAGSLTALGALLQGVVASITSCVNRPAYKVACTDSPTAQGDYVSWTSVEIDPTGDVDLTAEPDAINVTGGLWIAGSSAVVSYTGTPGNSVWLYGADAVNGDTSSELGAADYPPAGGSALSFSYLDPVVGDGKVSAQISAAGAGIPATQDVTASSYAVRISD